MLTERHLQIFVALAEEQHFGDAARVVGITQPPLSQGLRRLEALVGAKLFERGAGRVELTPAGAALLPYARRALSSIEEFHHAASVQDPDGPEIRLGLAPEVPASLGAAVAAACGTAVPGSRITVLSAPTSSLVNQVSTGRLTLAVALHPTVIDGLEAGPVELLPTWALVPTPTARQASTAAPADSLPTTPPVDLRSTGVPADRVPVAVPVELRSLPRLPVAIRPRAEAPAARDLFLDTLALHRPDGGTVVVTDERAGLAMTAAGQAILFTADPTLAAPTITRHPLVGNPLPLRLRLIWSATRTPSVLPVEAVPVITTALHQEVADGKEQDA